MSIQSGLLFRWRIRYRSHFPIIREKARVELLTKIAHEYDVQFNRGVIGINRPSVLLFRAAEVIVREQGGCWDRHGADFVQVYNALLVRYTNVKTKWVIKTQLELDIKIFED